jgi:hypothetical protein
MDAKTFDGADGAAGSVGVRIKTPATARNTDGIDADSATNVTVNDSFIQDGDDGIAIKTNSGAASNMTVENSHFYGTHGIGIGSETQHGVSNILVENNTVSGTDSAGNVSGDNNGIRIKTDSSVGGKVSDVTYENTCVTGVKHAMEFNPFYSSGNGSTTPDFTSIVVLGLRAVSSASSAQSVLEGLQHGGPARPHPGKREPGRYQHEFRERQHRDVRHQLHPVRHERDGDQHRRLRQRAELQLPLLPWPVNHASRLPRARTGQPGGECGGVRERTGALDDEVAVREPRARHDEERLAQEQVVIAGVRPDQVVAQDSRNIPRRVAAAGVVEQQPVIAAGNHLEERVPLGAVSRRPVSPVRVQPVLDDRGIATERASRLVEVEDLDELADAEHGRCPGVVEPPELEAGDRRGLRWTARGEHLVQFALGEGR